jgi:hypothetical protein
MSNLYIRTAILAGNLGDRWRDENEAAEAYADFLTGLLQAAFPDANINVSVYRNTRGCGLGMEVSSDGDDDVVSAQMECDIIYFSSWAEFLDTPQCIALLA